MLASSDAPLFNLAAMDADLALANAQQPQQRHSNSANSTRSRQQAASYLRRASDLTTISSSADKRPSVSSVLLSQLASSLDHELHDPDDAFDVPNVGLLGGTSSNGTNIGIKSSTTNTTSIATTGGGGRRSRARASVCILPPPPSTKVGGSGLPGHLRKEAYRRARSCPLEPHAELPHRKTMLDANHDSFRCLQVPPIDDLLHDGHNGSQNYFETMAGKKTFGQAAEQQETIGTPLASQIAASIHLTDAQLSERTAALNFILTKPAHFRQLQSDLRSSSVITTHCSSVVLDQLLSERVARMRQVREEALQKMREERDREREYARQMGVLPFDDNEKDGTDTGVMGKNAKGKGVAGWDHLLAGLTSVANLGAGLLNKQSLTLSDEQHPRHRCQQHSYNHRHHQVHDNDGGMDWNIDQPGMAAPKRPSSIVALQDIHISQQQQQDKKASLSAVAETMPCSSSGDFSLGEEQMQETQEVAAVRKASLDSSAAASLRASYSFSSTSSTSSTSLSSLVEGAPSAPLTAAVPTNTKASAEVATRRGGRRRPLVARGA